MRRVVFFACLLACAESGCADYRQKPVFPEGAAHRPVVNEQALLGLSPAGDALAAQLVDADGEPPQLWLAVFDARGGPTRKILQAPDAIARSISTQLEQQGESPQPLLERLVRAGWPEAIDKARELGFAEDKPAPGPAQSSIGRGGADPLSEDAMPGPFDQEIPVAGNRGPLMLLAALKHGPPPMQVWGLADPDNEYHVEVARMPVVGEPVGPRLYLHGGVAWMVFGSYLKGSPLHRAVGLRRADLRRGEAQLDNLRGLDALGAGHLEKAREAFADGIAADPSYVDVLYNAASTAALMNDDTKAVALLVRAAAVDPARVQVLGRSDPNLAELRKRKDVRDLLGQRRPAPENVAPPP